MARDGMDSVVSYTGREYKLRSTPNDRGRPEVFFHAQYRRFHSPQQLPLKTETSDAHTSLQLLGLLESLCFTSKCAALIFPSCPFASFASGLISLAL